MNPPGPLRYKNLFKKGESALEKEKGRESLEQKIYTHIKVAMFNKQIAPGTQLLEAVIAGELQVSRTPVRAAFKRLEQEGIIRIIANRGAFVIQPTLDEIRQMYDVRRELEVIAVKYGLPLVKPWDIKRLRALVEAEAAAYSTGDIEQYLLCNKQFHAFLARKSGNAVLLGMVEKTLDQSNAYTVLFDKLHTTGRPGSAGAHLGLAALVEAGDAAALTAALAEHVDESRVSLESVKNAYRPLRDIFT